MSEENVEVVRQAFEAWNRGDLEWMLDHITPDYEFRDSARGAFAAFERGDVSHMIDLMADDLVTHRIDPDNAIYHGKEGFFQATADWTEGFEDWTATAEEFLDAGDHVLVRVHQTARGEGSGVPVESHFWFVFEIRGRKIARLSFHVREAEALEAAGLRA